MRKKLIFTAALIALLFLLPVNIFMDMVRYDSHAPALFSLTEEDKSWVENLLERMDLKTRVAQMIVPYAYGRTEEDDEENYERVIKLVRDLKVGGIMFLQGDTYGQVALTNELQRQAEIPLLISADFERGPGMRLEDAIEFPYNMGIAAAGDPRLCYLMGKVTAIEARAMGVHHNYAPLLDINHDYRNPIINIRSFSDDADIISLYSEALIKGLHEGNLLSTAKHFPGHGATDLDSHQELPIINLSAEELWKSDLAVFRNAVNSGIKSVMVGHLEVPAFEKKEGLPATLSSGIIGDLLRKQLNFNGLVVTDAMNMHAITDNFEEAEAAVMSVKSGHDIILFPPDEEVYINAICEAVEKGEIDEKRIDQSVRKILSAKKWLGLDKATAVDTNALHKALGKPEHERLARELAEKSITILKDSSSLIPFNPAGNKSVACITVSDTRNWRYAKKKWEFEKKFSKEYRGTNFYKLTKRSRKAHYKKALKLARKSDYIILPVYIGVRSFQGHINIDEKHLEFIHDIFKLNKPVIMISFGNPYIIKHFPEAGTYIAAYGATDVSQSAAVEAVKGLNPVAGKLPVDIPGTMFFKNSGLQNNPSFLRSLKGISDSVYDFASVEFLLNEKVMKKEFPGAVLLVGHKNRIVYHGAFGNFSYVSNSRKMFRDAIFDLADMTRPLSTALITMMAGQDGTLDLNKKVSEYFPDFGYRGKMNITLNNLLVNNSGLPAQLPYRKYDDEIEMVEQISELAPVFEPGSSYLYSDPGYIILQKTVEKLAGCPADALLHRELFSKTGMSNTMFTPVSKFFNTCANRRKKGNAGFQGISRNSVLYTTSSDLAKLAYLLMNDGKWKENQVFKPGMVEEWAGRESADNPYAKGWKTNLLHSVIGKNFSENAFGINGKSGSSFWIDPENELFVIFLTSRVTPDGAENEIETFRPKLHNLCADAVSYF